MVERIVDDIYTFPIDLPENPLKWLNCYVVKSETGRSLLIDTGFNRPECLEALLAGMQELELNPETTDVFFTHLHADHTGNAAALQKMGCRLFMGGIDAAICSGPQKNSFAQLQQRALTEGMTEDLLKLIFDHNPAAIFASPPYDVITLEEGATLSYGGHTFECIHTPGHTPGHMCLYDRAHKLMFLGDHVLFDITPNICAWAGVEDSLGAYLDSLRKIAAYDIEIALPAHRHTGNVSVQERADTLIQHHMARLAETERIIADAAGLNAYQIAGRMKWRIRAENWDTFPPGQKWFAFGEALAHLDYLVLHGRAVRSADSKGNIVYALGQEAAG